MQELESKVAAIVQKVPIYNQIEESCEFIYHQGIENIMYVYYIFYPILLIIFIVKKIGIKAPLDELTANFLTDVEKKLADIISYRFVGYHYYHVEIKLINFKFMFLNITLLILIVRSQLDTAIKQLQQIESHRYSLTSNSTTELSCDVDVHKRLDEVEIALLQLSHDVHDRHTAELDSLLSSYEMLVS